MYRHSQGKIVIILPIIALAITGLFSAISAARTDALKVQNSSEQAIQIPLSGSKARTGDYIIVDLDANILFVKNGTTTLKQIDVVTQGKPGSYYETIGGEYYSDYKTKLHFSSFGHVFMPFSVHLFGNYFIHGIPYYPNGTKVSSAYSGGCVRLEDRDAEYVYNFITTETPVIITREGEDGFLPTEQGGVMRTYPDMTRIMTAILSLEMFNQDDEIYIKGKGVVTRKDLLTKLLSIEKFPSELIYKDKIREKDFVIAMNARAKTLGLTNTTFLDANSPVTTTEDDYFRFMNYVRVYKSFLLQY